MKLAMSIINGDRDYYLEFNGSKQAIISEKPSADLTIPSFGKTLIVRWNESVADVKIITGMLSRLIAVPLGIPTAIDAKRNISLCISRVMPSISVKLPSTCRVNVGKSNKTGSNGEQNDIIVDISYISRFHFHVIRIDGVTVVYDDASKNGLFLNGKRINKDTLKKGDILSVYTVRFIYDGYSLQIENVGDALKTLPIKEADKRKAAKTQLVPEESYYVHRSPRLMTYVEKDTIEIERPPQARGVPKINWLSVLVTPFISVGLMIALVLIMGLSPVMLIMSGVMSVVSAISAIANYRKQKKQYGKTDDVITEKYQQYLSRVSEKLKESHTQQLDFFIRSNPDISECLQIAKNFDTDIRIWERRSEDEDFLVARVGLGMIKAFVSAKFQHPQFVIEETDLEKQARELASQSTVIADAPILFDFLNNRLTGITGTRSAELQLVRNLIVQLVTFHSYNDLKIIALVPKNEFGSWNWLRWLPHCTDDSRSRKYIFTSLDECEETLSEIREVLENRQRECGSSYDMNKEDTKTPHYLFISANKNIIERHPIRKTLISGEESGSSLICLYDQLSSLPKECTHIIEVSKTKGTLYEKNKSEKKTTFTMDQLTLAEADQFARAMAPLYTDAESAAASLPSNISFFEGYGISQPDELRIAERWAKAKTYKTMSVPIAAMSDGGIFNFDIHEKHHGVNGMVAGMPGSGKTEMVQSWLLSLAVNYSPQDVSFVLIDFKGTGMIAPFRTLPHLAGSISDLDIKKAGKAGIDRNLLALQSEIHRREDLIDKYSDYGVKNINSLNEAYAKGQIPEGLPVLLVVIDEYAEFKKTFPDFGAEIDSLTSKGRALGVFVILMTQKPAGVVSAKSEDNIKFRWCLRVANYSASREMLGKPDAARITNPGRAYIKVGEDDVYELVQSFFSGEKYDPGRRKNESAFIPIRAVRLDGSKIAFEITEKKKTQTDNNEIDVVVRYLAQYCKENGIVSANQIWTEGLPDRLSLNEVLLAVFDGTAWPETDHLAPSIGLVDEPATQQQYPLVMDFAKTGHTTVYGAPVTGKTTLLETLAMSIAMTRRPDQVSIYIMDFGGWNLQILRDLPHIGGIINDNEPERLKKLMILLTDMLQERKEKLSRIGVGNITAYRDATGDQLPDVLLLVDNIGAMLKMYPEVDTFFISLTSFGANYGIYLVSTASAANAVPIKISANIKNAIALQMIDKSEYTYLVGKATGQLPSVVGRGFAKGSPPLEFQTALPAPGDDDKSVSDNIRKIAKVMEDVWQGVRPAPIPEMPETIPYGSLRGSGIQLGLSTDKVAPISYNHLKQHYLVISGIAQSGKSNLLSVIARQYKEKLGGKLCVFAVKGSMSEVRDIADVYLTNAQEIDAFVEAMRPELQKRQTEKQRNDDIVFTPITIIIDDYTVFFKGVSNDTISRLLAIVKLGSGLGLNLIASADAYELSSYVAKGEAVSLTMARGKQSVMLGGCLNDHAAIQTKIAFAQKSVAVKEHEGFFISRDSVTIFKSMFNQGE